ncbi:MAG: hypothetical protein JKY65_19530 [Planctomycetes bacterium]|nr:hypothetical protein [Planctomycetota bacterium]
MRLCGSLFAGIFLLVGLGCTGPTATIRELGQPAFEPLLGDLRLARVDEEQTGGFDAFDPDTAQPSSDHRIALRFWPLADDETIAIEVRARGIGELPLRDIAAAVYPATRLQCAAYQATGQLPTPEPIFYSGDSKSDLGGRVLTMTFPRSDLPPGTVSLAVPVLLRFEDGWIRVQYYKTTVPEPLRRETPEVAAERAKQEVEDSLAAKRVAGKRSPEDEKSLPEGSEPEGAVGATSGSGGGKPRPY